MEKEERDETTLLVNTLRDMIKSTVFDNKVYLCGDFLKDMILEKFSDSVELCIDSECDAKAFSYWLANKTNSLVNGINPQLLTGDCYGLTIEDEDSPLSGFSFTCFNRGDENIYSYMCDSLLFNISTSELIDETGYGLYDIKNRLIRLEDSDGKVFASKPIEMLRVIRDSTINDFDVARETWVNIVSNARHIKDAPKISVTSMISQILLSKKPSVGLKRLNDSGLLDYMFESIGDLSYVKENVTNPRSVWEHTMSVVDSCPRKLNIRLAALFHDSGKGAGKGVERSSVIAKYAIEGMSFPKDSMDSVYKMIRMHDFFSSYSRSNPVGERKVKEFMKLCDNNITLINDTLDLIHANNINQLYGKKASQVPDIKKKVESILEKERKQEENSLKLPINGNDIIRYLGIKKGPIIGSLLRKVKDAFLVNNNMNKDEALELVKKEVKKVV